MKVALSLSLSRSDGIFSGSELAVFNNVDVLGLFSGLVSRYPLRS